MKKVGELIVSLGIILGVVAFTKGAANLGEMDMRRNMLIVAGVMAICGVIMVVNAKGETDKK